MALMITEDCIGCGACEPECPNNAIYEQGETWIFPEKITELNQKRMMPPLSEEVFFIVPQKCTECVGFHEEPQCAMVCPVDCCVPDPDWVESKEDLLKKKVFLESLKI
jgi:ferredoxin